MMAPIEAGSIAGYLSRIAEAGQSPTTLAKPQIGSTEASAFAEVLKGTLSQANQAAETAREAAVTFASGTRDDIHGTMIALSKADIELRLVGSVRNKVIDAFHEIWKMQI
jgi:flagellar hook-basal body complex protein FliE